MKAELVIDSKSTLGEGSFWDPRTGVLYWVDIQGNTIHVYNPSSDDNTSRRLDGRPGTVVPRRGPGLVVAMEHAVVLLDGTNAEPRELCVFGTEPSGNRLNDGKCDPAGRLWVGTMSGDRTPNGTLYCVEPDGSFRAMLPGVTVSNGIVWTADQKTMYYIDTATRCVQAFDYKPGNGAISNRRVAFEVAEGHGRPDGMTIDMEGKVWIALFGGGAVRRYDPTDGSELAVVEVPASNVTSCALGGPDLRDLYITTARIGLPESTLEGEPLAGGLFRCRVDVPGVPQPLFGG